MMGCRGQWVGVLTGVLIAWVLGGGALRAAAGATPNKQAIPDGVYVRILVFGHAFKSQWDAEGHTADDILKMIGELKPDVLDRLIDGKQNPDLAVPVDAGGKPMTELAFLDAAMKAGAPGCTIAPKIHLNNVWSNEYRFDAAQSLRDLPLTPRLWMVDLDSWFSKKHDASGNKAMLARLRAMGWTCMVTNPGPYKSAYGYESSTMTYMSTKTWLPPRAKVRALHRKGIALPLVHIDYPSEINVFRRLPPDRQAAIITAVAAAQRTDGYRFIYPVLYGHYDSTKVVTSNNGPYHGVTIFQIIRQCIERDREAATTNHP